MFEWRWAQELTQSQSVMQCTIKLYRTRTSGFIEWKSRGIRKLKPQGQRFKKPSKVEIFHKEYQIAAVLAVKLNNKVGTLADKYTVGSAIHIIQWTEELNKASSDVLLSCQTNKRRSMFKVQVLR